MLFDAETILQEHYGTNNTPVIQGYFHNQIDYQQHLHVYEHFHHSLLGFLLHDFRHIFAMLCSRVLPNLYTLQLRCIICEDCVAFDVMVDLDVRASILYKTGVYAVLYDVSGGGEE